MGCQPTLCKNCGNSVAACQLLNGLCGACRSIKNFLKIFYNVIS